MDDKFIDSFLKNNPEFGTESQMVGSGYNGKVYSTNKGFIVKITKDKEEFETTQKIHDRMNGEFTPMYYFLSDLEFPGLYIIVMEDVDPINITSQQSAFLNAFRDKLNGMLENNQDVSFIKKQLQTIPDKKLSKLLIGITDAAVALKKIGIINADIQEDNIAVNKAGKVVFMDVVDKTLVQESLLRKIRKIIKEIKDI